MRGVELPVAMRWAPFVASPGRQCWMARPQFNRNSISQFHTRCRNRPKRRFHREVRGRYLGQEIIEPFKGHGRPEGLRGGAEGRLRRGVPVPQSRRGKPRCVAQSQRGRAARLCRVHRWTASPSKLHPISAFLGKNSIERAHCDVFLRWLRSRH